MSKVEQGERIWWYCSCGTNNQLIRKTCAGCGKKRRGAAAASLPESQPAPEMDAREWLYKTDSGKISHRNAEARWIEGSQDYTLALLNDYRVWLRAHDARVQPSSVDGTREIAGALVKALKDIKQLLGSESPYTLKRSDGMPIEFCEQIRVGNIFEKADSAIEAAESALKESSR